MQLSTEDITFLKHFILPEKEIAEKLVCSKSKVQWEKKKIFSRLNAASAFHAVLKAVHLGIIKLEDIVL